MKRDVVARMVSMLLQARDREKLWSASANASAALVEYGKLLAGEVPEEAVRFAADAALAVFEYLIAAAAEEGKREAIAEVLARLDERLLIVLAARLAVREEKGER